MTEKEVEIWGRPLVKMTTPELKDIAKGVEGISGVHGMKKEELIEVLRKSKGIVDDAVKKTESSLRSIKRKIQSIRAERAGALEARNRKLADIYRRRIARLKKKTRRASA